MSSELKVRAARAGKYFGKDCKLNEDMTDTFDPLNPTHMNMLDSGALKLVKSETKPEPKPKTVTKTDSRSKAK